QAIDGDLQEHTKVAQLRAVAGRGQMPVALTAQMRAEARQLAVAGRDRLHVAAQRALQPLYVRLGAQAPRAAVPQIDEAVVGAEVKVEVTKIALEEAEERPQELRDGRVV